ncbi:MAG TPA: hypothetical protein VM287_04420 [Egibacteraceae bacterium]|nr:hypothetical protein [Egibacteraceae bacterium]
MTRFLRLLASGTGRRPMSATSVLRAVMLGVLLLTASGCRALHIGGERANVEAQPAVHDQEAARWRSPWG